MEPKQPTVGVPMNVYDALDRSILGALEAQLEADVDLESFTTWLDDRVDEGSVPRIVADHIAQWNLLKATTDAYVAGYEAYTRSRLDEWDRLGLAQPSNSMFGALLPAVSDKQPRNGPCQCGSGRKFKRCHGAPGASN